MITATGRASVLLALLAAPVAAPRAQTQPAAPAPRAAAGRPTTPAKPVPRPPAKTPGGAPKPTPAAARPAAGARGAGAAPAAVPAAKAAAAPKPSAAAPAEAPPAAPVGTAPETAAPATGGHPAAGPAVHYTVSFPNAVHHEARVVATFAGLTPGVPLQVRMARSSPGRYALHDFAKNVYYTVATDGAGKLLALSRPDPYGWTATPGADGTVQFSYTLYGDQTDGTYVGIDQQHAHLNAPATFCYAVGLEARPAVVKFDAPATWKIASQLRTDFADKTAYSAPNLQYLFDSPVVLGAPQVTHAWQDGGRNFEIATYYNQGPAAEVDAHVRNVQKVVREAAGVFGGEYPEFDFGRYTFLADYLSQTESDGMEHRNSCSLTSPLPLREAGATRNLGTVSHEFIHAWNVERLRPKDLEPFDFQRVNMSDALWFAEGFTTYYGELVMRRAGFYDDEQFFGRLSGWVNQRTNSPGARYASAVDMSRAAAFNDDAASAAPTNAANTYLSYYTQGAGLALALDLQLRQRHRTTLDKYMQALWQQFGKKQDNYAPARPYTLKDLQRVLGEVARDTAFAGTFFRRYVVGRETPRFAENLALAGLAVVPTRALGAALPNQVQFDAQGRCFVAYNTTMGSGLYKAGIDRGDQILVLDGETIDSPAKLDAVLHRHSPADLVLVRVKTRGDVERSLQLVLTEDPNVQVQPMENVQKMTATPAQKELRTAWLASAAK